MTPTTPDTRPQDELARPLTAEEVDAIRGRDASARNPARTWAVEDRRRLLATLDVARADTAGIDAAWREAEAALRSHDVFELRVGVFAPGVSYWADGWHGDMDAGPRGTDMRGITTDGPTPAAALLALAAALRTPKPEGEPE